MIEPNTVYNINCIDIMQEMVENNIKVDLTVTSPPYDNLRSYTKDSTWNFGIFKTICNLLYKVTVDDGIVVWVNKCSIKI